MIDPTEMVTFESELKEGGSRPCGHLEPGSVPSRKNSQYQVVRWRHACYVRGKARKPVWLE